VFKNALGVKIDSIDATPFLNDGMVESVYIDHETEELVIVWNTQSGQQETRIPLTEIFNPNDYYTKDEIDGIVDGITSSITEVEDSINEEANRAIGAETALQTAIDGETQRAQGAEGTLQITIETEAQRAQDAEDALQAAIDDIDGDISDAVNVEEARAISAETALNEKLNREIARSMAKDEAHDDQLDILDQRLGLVERQLPDEITERKEKAFADAEYDENAKEIVFKNAFGVKIDSIDATPFLNDGMVDRVYIDQDTRELVIVWNTQSGQQETRIPLSEIFNPDDYYTKDEIDDIVDDITSAITETEENLEDKIAQLRQALNNEVDRATAKEEELEGADIVSGNIASDATISVTKNNGNVITFASAEQIEIEAGEF
jgi:hypothetical protein